jgi:hypothetical protein
MPPVSGRCCDPTKTRWVQARRLHAAELFVACVGQTEVLHGSAPPPRAASVWHGRCKAAGPQASHSATNGPVPRPSDAQLAQVGHLLGLASYQITWRRLDASWSTGSSTVGRTVPLRLALAGQISFCVGTP